MVFYSRNSIFISRSMWESIFHVGFYFFILSLHLPLFIACLLSLMSTTICYIFFYVTIALSLTADGFRRGNVPDRCCYRLCLRSFTDYSCILRCVIFASSCSTRCSNTPHFVPSECWDHHVSLPLFRPPRHSTVVFCAPLRFLAHHSYFSLPLCSTHSLCLFFGHSSFSFLSLRRLSSTGFPRRWQI